MQFLRLQISLPRSYEHLISNLFLYSDIFIQITEKFIILFGLEWIRKQDK